MALSWGNRVKETCTVTGTTDPYALAGAATGFQAFSAIVANAGTCKYCAVGQTSNSWEIGKGTYTSSGNTLARTTVEASSNSNSAVSWGAETIDIFLDVPASLIAILGTNVLSSGNLVAVDTNGNLVNTQNLFSVVDRSADGSGYTLLPGETIYKAFTTGAGTSIPLYVTTVEGIYEITIVGDGTVTASNSNDSSLNPNDTTYSTALRHQGFYMSSNTGTLTPENALLAAVTYSSGLLLSAKLTVFTYTKSKAIHLKSTMKFANGYYYTYDFNVTWVDFTTAWTSLGTLALPFAQNLKMIIKRIL